MKRISKITLAGVFLAGAALAGCESSQPPRKTVKEWSVAPPTQKPATGTATTPSFWGTPAASTTTNPFENTRSVTPATQQGSSLDTGSGARPMSPSPGYSSSGLPPTSTYTPGSTTSGQAPAPVWPVKPQDPTPAGTPVTRESN